MRPAVTRRRFALQMALCGFCIQAEAQNGNVKCVAVNPQLGAWTVDQCATSKSGLPGVVSAHALAFRASKPAQQEFDRGVHAWRKGRSSEAILHFSGAVRLAPGFVDALANLAVVYTNTRDFARALEYLDQALSLDSNQEPLHARKAAVLIMLKRPQEAEQEARRAAQLDPQSPDAHFTIGVAMFMQGRKTPELIQHLSAAASTYPSAHALLAIATEDFAALYLH